jgi:regulator of replication initiation timing
MTLEAPLKRIEERASEDLRRAETRLELSIARLEQQVLALSNSVNFMEKQIGRDIERHNTLLLEIQKKQDQIAAGHAEVFNQAALTSHTVDVLAESMADLDRKATTLKMDLQPLQAHMHRIDGVIKVSGVIVTLVGLAATIYELVRRR